MNFKNQLGMSLVEILMATAMLGGGALIVMKGGDLLNKSKEVQRSGVGLQLLNEDLLNTSSRILTGVSNTAGKNVNGICKMTHTNAKAPGVGQIFIKLNKGKEVFTSKTWENDFKNWTPQKDSRCKNLKGWNKCFAFKAETINTGISAKKMETMNIAASVEVVPVGMNPYKSPSGSLFYPLNISSSENIDAKDISFKIITKLYFTKDEKDQLKIEEDFVWAPSVGVCDSTLNNASKSPVKLSLSGAGASDPKGRTVYNRSGFTGNDKDPVRVDWRRNIAQAGITLENGSFITTDQTKNIYGSCNEVTYRCPQVASDKRDYGPINMMLNMTYNSKSVLGHNTLVRLKPNFIISKGESSNIVDKDDVTFIVDSVSTSSPGEEITINGSHSLNINVSKDGKGDGPNQLCRKVCTDSSNYNTNGATYSERYSPYIKFNFHEFNKEFKYGTTQGLGCTACYMKNCSQFGIGTFGPMTQMPNQPQDSPVPECHRYEPKIPKLSPAFSMNKTLKGAPVSDSAPRCIKARLSSSTGKLVYEPDSCDKKLPVMCFNFGQFLLARDVFGDDEDLSKVSFNKGNRRCFEMGREVSQQDRLLEFMGKTSLNFPTNSDGDFDFINLANQGTFFAPQFEKDVVQFRNWMKTNGVNFDTWFWVPMVRDSQSHARYLAPFVPKMKSSDKHALIFMPNGTLADHTYGFDIKAQAESGENALLLTHHIKFKGLIPVKKDNPMGGREFHFLCRKNGLDGNFFISKEKDKEFSKGKDACAKEGGLFLPPNTTSQWVTAYNLVNRFHPQFAFPAPGQKTQDSIPFAWVALVTNGADAKDIKLASEFDYKPLGGMKHYTPDFSNDPYTLIDGEGHYKDPRATLEGFKIDEDDAKDIEIKDGEYFEFYATGIGTIKVDLNDSGAKVNMSLQEIVDKVNAGTSKAKLTIKKIDDDYRVTLKPNKIAPNQVIKLMGGIDKELGFKNNQSEKGPDFKFMCLKDNGDISRVDKKFKCSDGKILKFSDIKDSLDMHITLNTLGYGKFDIFQFEL